jgi:hypothetical protein
MKLASVGTIADTGSQEVGGSGLSVNFFREYSVDNERHNPKLPSEYMFCFQERL